MAQMHEMLILFPIPPSIFRFPNYLQTAQHAGLLLLPPSRPLVPLIPLVPLVLFEPLSAPLHTAVGTSLMIIEIFIITFLTLSTTHLAKVPS